MTSLTIMGPSSFLGFDPEKWIQFISLTSVLSSLQKWYWITSLTSIIGTWLGAFPILLDWERPWQVWPIPCCCGAILGFLFGNIIFLVYSIFDSEEKKKRI